MKVFWNFVRYKPEHAEGGLNGHGLRHLVDLEHVAQVDREVHPGQKKQDFHHFLRGVLLIVKQNNWAMEEKNTIRDGDTTALYTVLTAYTVYNVNTVSTVYTIRNCFTLFKQ